MKMDSGGDTFDHTIQTCAANLVICQAARLV